MTKEELKIQLDKWFTENWEWYLNEVATNIAYGQMSEYSTDLALECYEGFMSKSDTEKEQMLRDGKIGNFLLYAASFQIRSGSSPFYRRMRKSNNKVVPYYIAENEGKDMGVYNMHETSIDDLYTCMISAIKEESIGWYYSKLLELKYLKQMTYQELTKTYGVCITTVKRDIAEALNLVKQKCNHLN